MNRQITFFIQIDLFFYICFHFFAFHVDNEIIKKQKMCIFLKKWRFQTTVNLTVQKTNQLYIMKRKLNQQQIVKHSYLCIYIARIQIIKSMNTPYGKIDIQKNANRQNKQTMSFCNDSTTTNVTKCRNCGLTKPHIF